MSQGVDIKLKDLRYLVAVADARHFGRAAEKCFVSQPTLSAQLKKLEDYLGVQLIERQPKNVTLTEAGEQIVARARRILEASEEVVTLARAHRDPLGGAIAVGAACRPSGRTYCHGFRRLYARRWRDWSCVCTSTRRRRCWRGSRPGSIDLGILALPVDVRGV